MLSRTLRTYIAAAIIVVSGTAIAQQQMGPAMTGESVLGTILVGPNGLTLYTFDRDEPSVTNCYGGCPNNWPPFFVGGNAAMADENWTIVDRTDGDPMWAYKGQPLYFWINDVNPGDVNGDGAGPGEGGIWHVVSIPAM